jgi:hypothetical protein
MPGLKFWQVNNIVHRWMCRKGFAAINMQATVDLKCKFMKMSLRPGSNSDKLLWSLSNLGAKNIKAMPPGMHFVGDAGSTISTRMMSPYPITEDMDAEEKLNNKLHSRTRIAVERAFGILKGKWRILRRVLNMKTGESCASTFLVWSFIMSAEISLTILVSITNRTLSLGGSFLFFQPSPPKVVSQHCKSGIGFVIFLIPSSKNKYCINQIHTFITLSLNKA